MGQCPVKLIACGLVVCEVKKLIVCNFVVAWLTWGVDMAKRLGIVPGSSTKMRTCEAIPRTPFYIYSWPFGSSPDGGLITFH